VKGERDCKITVNVQAEIVAQQFNLEFEVQLEFGYGVYLHKQAHVSHHPHIWRSKDFRFATCLQDLTNKRYDSNKPAFLIGLENKFLRDVLKRCNSVHRAVLPSVLSPYV
jgi:hypothetical protein